MTHENVATASNQPLDQLKTSALDRRLSIAKASLNIGRRWATNSAFGLFKSKEEKAVQKQAFMREQAQYLVDELGKLKGSVVKIGQMLALYGEHFLPPEITEALQTLNAQTTAFAYPIIESAIIRELGEKIHDFDIDPTPIGTASLAQVHKATLKATGEQVALKVQYPNISEAIDSDLALFRHLLKVTNVVPQTRELDEWFEEIRDLLHHEVDYTAEANTTQKFYQRLANDNRYVVAKIYPQYSTARLMTMSYEQGVSILDERVFGLSQARRNRIGEASIEIMLREIFEWGDMQTDPNFGNYLIRLAENTHENSDEQNAEPVDQLVLLDFGAIRQFDEPLLSIAQGFLHAGFYHDKSAMLNAIDKAGEHFAFFAEMNAQIRDNMAELFLLASEPFSLPQLNPTIPPEALDSEGNYVWANSDLHNRVIQLAGKSATSKAFSVPPKEFMFISRKFIGAYTFMTVLGAKTDARDLIKGFLL
ncbi:MULTISPECIES: ABC1 kinase family protein [unclassified Moraxella]|uniref:ABC1 kinase family protein n=1 Tax=unclassified Moraxella TaxID=2685852 RepID=UPI003AF71F0B